MIRPSPDRLFDRFRRTGDARALARVFDATAPELWRVATYLCRDRHAAEDAVQSAFLSAIEARRDWDASRPLVPWLLGHLANRVRELRRAAAKRPDAARLVPSAVPDPAEVAALREAAAMCADALDQLDEPFRSTLEQHLVHGKAAHEIAAESGVPAGTVRMRLHRGLDQLRQKLPASVLAGGAAVVPLPPASLVAMREVVLAKVPGATAVVGSGHVGSLVIGALLMNKLAWSVAASAALLLSLWWAWPANAVAPIDPADRLAVPAERVASATGAPLPQADAGVLTPLERTTVASLPALDARSHLRVVLRNAGNGEAVAGARVEVRNRLKRAAEKGPWSAPVATARGSLSRVTAADGAAEFELRPGAAEVRVEPFRVTRAVDVAAGGENELLLELPVRVDADVVVVDPSGAPVPNARILGFTQRDLVADGFVELGRTDTDGVWKRPFVDEVVTLRAVVDGRAASPALELHPGARRTTLRIGAEEAVVRGVVVGPDGVPLANAPVGVQSVPRANDDTTPIVGRADAQGRFEVRNVRAGACLVFAVRHLADGQARLARAETTAVAGAATNVDVHFGRGGMLDVRLRRADGAPVTGQRVILRLEHRALEGAFSRLGWAIGDTDANGEARIDGLLPGRYAVQVAMPDLLVNEIIDLGEDDLRRFEPAIGSVQGARTLTVRVVDETQQPLAGWLVRIVPRSERGGEETASTDAAGLAVFPGLVEDRYRVRLFAARNSFALLTQDVDNGATVTLVAPAAFHRSGVIHGRLLGAEDVLQGVRVALHRAENGPTSRERVEVACDAGSGVFRAEHLPPGRYHVQVESTARPKVLAFRTNFDVGAVPVDIGDIPIGVGSLRVRATFADGRPVPGAEIRIGADGIYGPPPGGVADGVAGDLPAASLGVLVWSEATAAVVTAAEIRSGETTELTVTTVPGARITVRFGPGITAPMGLLRVRQGGAEQFAVVVTPKDPLVRGFAPGSYELEFDDMRGKRCSTPLAVAADLAPCEVTLRPPQ